MMEHPRLLDSLRLIEAGKVTSSLDRALVVHLHGCGNLSTAIWQANAAKPALVTITTCRGKRNQVLLTNAGRQRLCHDGVRNGDALK